MKKRLSAMLLALCMMLSLLPMASAEETQASAAEIQTATEKPLYYMGANGKTPVCDALRMTRGIDIMAYLYTDSAGEHEIASSWEARNSVTFVPDSADDAGAVSVEPRLTRDAATNEPVYDGWVINFDGFGSGKIVYTEGGVSYSFAVESILPNYGFSTEPTLSRESFLETGSNYDIGTPFYFVFPEGVSIESMDYDMEFCDSAVVECISDEQYSDNVWQFTYTSRPRTNGYAFFKVIFHTDMENEIEEHGTAGFISLALSENSSLPQLGTPTKLAWGVDQGGLSRPGVLSAQVTAPTQNRYFWSVYRVEAGKDPEWAGGGEYDYGSLEAQEYIYNDSFVNGYSYNDTTRADDRCIESGRYYFTVYAEGDGVNYRDSEAEESYIWTYVKPEGHLLAPTDLTWDEEERTVSWSYSSTDDTWGYEVAYFIKNDDGTWREIGTSWGKFEEMEDKLENFWLEDNGSGEYAARVRALSTDITKICNSVWSELSPALNVTGITSGATDKMQTILGTNYGDTDDDGALTDPDSRDAVREAVAEISGLETALAADQGEEGGAVEMLAALEELVGGAADVAVDEALEDFDANKVSIVGANLNTSGDATTTLQIGKPESGEAIEEQYENAIAFSMKLDGVNGDETSGHQKLAVPVHITMPVPKGINPDFLVLLHRSVDGSVEEIIFPHIFKEGDTTYAAFVITSFSDFAFAELRYEIGLEENMLAVYNAPRNAQTILAAVYDAAGKMLSCAVQTAADKITEAEAEGFLFTLPQMANGASIRVFYLDESSAPMQEALVIDLTARNA